MKWKRIGDFIEYRIIYNKLKIRVEILPEERVNLLVSDILEKHIIEVIKSKDLVLAERMIKHHAKLLVVANLISTMSNVMLRFDHFHHRGDEYLDLTNNGMDALFTKMQDEMLKDAPADFIDERVRKLFEGFRNQDDK